MIKIQEQQTFLNSITPNCAKQFGINAMPGSGKTFCIGETIKKINSFNPNAKKLVCAYNNLIVDALTEKFNKKSNNLFIYTIHAAAFHFLKKAKPYGFEVTNLKYTEFVEPELNKCNIDSEEPILYSQITKIFNLMKENLCESSEYIANKYGIEVGSVELFEHLDKIFIKMYQNPFKFKEGKYFNGYVYKKGKYIKISFTDQIYLTVIKNLIPDSEKYDYIIVDEAQDLTPLKLKFLQMLGKPNCVFFFFGDKNQTINQYAGSDSSLFEKICHESAYYEFNQTLRCPQEVVKLINEIYPNNPLKYHKNNRKGEVLNYTIKQTFDFIKNTNENIYIMSPKNEPLFHIYLELIKLNIIPYLKGFDIKEYIINLLKRSKDLNDLKNNIDKILGSTYKELKKEYPDLTLIGIHSNQLFKTHNEPISILLSLLKYFYNIDLYSNEILNIEIKDILNKFYILFSSSIPRQITLLSCHKSKGMECENIILINSDELFSKSDAQTTNLAFVSLTRPLNRLIFVNQFELKDLATLIK